jgi:hypothetical protein
MPSLIVIYPFQLPAGVETHQVKQHLCRWIKDVSTYDPQAYGPTPFSPRDSLGSCQSTEQGDYKRLIYLCLLTYTNPIYG